MKKFLIINPFGIGDVLFTTPLVRAVKLACPDSFIGYWCNQRVRDILRNNPHIDKAFALSRGDIKHIYQHSKKEGLKSFLCLLSEIRKVKFDACFDFSLDHRYSLITKLLGIRRRVGFNYKGRGLFLTDKLAFDGYSHKHVVEYYLELLKPLNIAPAGNQLELFTSERSKIKVKNMLNCLGIKGTDLLVGIAPGAGASWGKDAAFKHWSAIKFAQLADLIASGYGAKVAVLGD